MIHMLPNTTRRATENLRTSNAARRGARVLNFIGCALIVAGMFSLRCRPAAAVAPSDNDMGSAAVAHAVVINEINYNSHEDSESKDWVELYNAGAADVDLTGWTYSDEDDEHVFAFPDGTILKSGEYLVVVQETASFSAIHPDVSNIAGDADFGLAGGGELVRLFDASGAIADSLTYGDSAPWPEAADGDGYTLALADPTCDNHLPECWRASEQMNGTPGAANFTTDAPDPTSVERETPEAPFQVDIYPNPAVERTTVSVSGTSGGAVRIDVFDIRGRRVPISATRLTLPGSAALDTGNLAAGLYFVRISSSRGTAHRAVMVER